MGWARQRSQQPQGVLKGGSILGHRTPGVAGLLEGIETVASWVPLYTTVKPLLVVR